MFTFQSPTISVLDRLRVIVEKNYTFIMDYRLRYFFQFSFGYGASVDFFQYRLYTYIQCISRNSVVQNFKCNFIVIIIIILQSRNLSRSLIRHFLSIQSSLKVHTTTGHFFFLLACLFAQKILSCYPISITKTNIQESILGGIYLFSTFISNILFRYESFY